MSQSKDNEAGKVTECPSCQWWLGHRSEHIKPAQFCGLRANFNLMEKAFILGISFWFFLWIMSGYLSVCMQKDVSVLPIFHSDFYAQIWQKSQNTAVSDFQPCLQNKVKNTNILRNTTNICNFNINIIDVLSKSFHLICYKTHFEYFYFSDSSVVVPVAVGFP